MRNFPEGDRGPQPCCGRSSSQWNLRHRLEWNQDGRLDGDAAHPVETGVTLAGVVVLDAQYLTFTLSATVSCPPSSGRALRVKQAKARRTDRK